MSKTLGEIQGPWEPMLTCWISVRYLALASAILAVQKSLSDPNVFKNLLEIVEAVLCSPGRLAEEVARKP